MALREPQDSAKATLLHLAVFLKRWMRRPKGIGAIAPSSAQLAAKMVHHLDLAPDLGVVEIGPGTGVFTHALLQAGVQPQNLVLVERDPEFAKHLAKRFPNLRIIEGDACDLPELIKGQIGSPVSRVISGLPLRSMPREIRSKIAGAISKVLPPDGVLVQFSYFSASPIDRDIALEENLDGRQVDHVLRNFPPAYVWKYVKRK
jgi:phosphatidylethanolamine/phosphatidyl-N-methylethanolamine N-methyltransferase